MDKATKRQVKAEIGRYIDLTGCRLKDNEVEELKAIVDRRDEYNGRSRKYRKEYKTFDSEDTYRVEETNVYIFRSDDSGIHIDTEQVKTWDDGQVDKSHSIIRNGRGILNGIKRIIRK